MTKTCNPRLVQSREGYNYNITITYLERPHDITPKSSHQKNYQTVSEDI